MKKKTLLFLLCSLFAVSACTTPADNPNSDDPNVDNPDTPVVDPVTDDFGKDAVKLSFKSAASYDYLATLNGKEVTINGYMATSSPVDGSFIFLMNMPYQSCPFCKPNTSQLSNTIEVYPKTNDKFNYTTSAIKVVGKMMVADDPNQPFTDPYEYEFVFKIVDAEYKILKESDLTGNLALWQKFASTTLITDLYKMCDYIDFVCKWPTYFVNSYTDSSGTYHNGFYLWPADAKQFIETNGAQYNYGYVEGYFEKFITRLNKISATGFEELIQIINDAQALATYALAELNDGHYTSQEEYMERFGYTDYVFTLNDKTLETQADDIYYAFADWLSSFEM